MNTIRVLLATTLLLTSVHLAHAGPSDETRKGASITVAAGEGDGPERITARQRVTAGKPHLLSTNRLSELLLKDDAVTMQLSDYGLSQIGAEEKTRGKAERFLGNVLKTMALSGVKQMLDHGLALPLADTRSAQVRDGEVVILTCQGKEVFNKVKINNQIQKYPQESADEFVRAVNRARAKLPACRG